MTLLIKNVHILGGAGHGSETKDVFISGDTISAIGDFSDTIANEILDGRGAYLSPGFIDAHAESDHYLGLLKQPSQEEFLKQGITTAVSGYGGVSLAPFLAANRDSIRAWADPRGVNFDWHTVKEFLHALNRRKLGVNFLTFAGYETLRRAIGVDESREMKPADIRVFSSMLTRALRDGVAGLSIDLESRDGRESNYRELKKICEILAKHGGIYAGNLRRAAGGAAKDAITFEILEKLHKETGVRILVNGLSPEKNREGEYEKILKLIRESPSRKWFRFTVQASAVSVLPLHSFLPEWMQKETMETALENLRDAWRGERIMNDLPALNPDEVIILIARGHEPLEGRSLHEVMRMYGIPNSKRALLKLMLLTKLNARVALKNIDHAYLRTASARRAALLGSLNASPRIFGEKRVKDAYFSFPRFASRLVQEHAMALDAVIKKVTAEPAEFFGLSRRGSIAEGNIADLVVFRASGKNMEIHSVIVNGRIAVRDGEVTGVLGGRALRRISNF